MSTSPFYKRPKSVWLDITKQLVDRHPLKPAVLLELATTTWNTLWQSTVGEGALAVRLAELRVPATVIGYFFEVLLARDLARRQPGVWRGNQSKEEKDLEYVPDPALSVEIKTSGQAGFKVYGNRSYGQKSTSELGAKKEKSGFYLTVNFFERNLTLLRFGWIDADDWRPQRAATGQMAGLGEAVYDYKLIPILGDYRLQTPVALLDGVGPVSAKALSALGIHTVGDLISRRHGLSGALARIVERNEWYLGEPAPPTS
jgi:hypothetical protein